MEDSIFLLEISAFWNNIATNLTIVEFCGEIRTTAFALHILVKDRTHPVS
jgi:hypothetical protein